MFQTFEPSGTVDYTARLRTMLDGKTKIAELSALCDESPKKFIKHCEESYNVDVAAKILLFSRDVKVESVTEAIGNKKFDSLFQAFLSL